MLSEERNSGVLIKKIVIRLLATRHSQLITHNSSLTTHHSPFTTHYTNGVLIKMKQNVKILIPSE